MKLLRRLFGRGKGSDEGKRRVHYVPGQTEPQEYTSLVTHLIKSQAGRPYRNPLLIVGFRDENSIRRIAEGRGGIRLFGEIMSTVSFDSRNPVLIVGYGSLSFTDRTGLAYASHPLTDAKTLKNKGATDISALEIDMATAVGLRQIYGALSCPILIGVDSDLG